MEDRTACFSLDADVNAMLKSQPTFNSLTSAADSALLLALHLIGVAPFIPTSYLTSLFGFTLQEITDLGFFERIPVLNSFPVRMQWWVVNLIPWLFARPDFYQHLNTRGIPILCLGVNDKKKLQKCVDIGANAVLTDRPEWLGSVDPTNLPTTLDATGFL
jgi:glycerophosphoryl diester phosphodiesterase